MGIIRQELDSYGNPDRIRAEREQEARAKAEKKENSVTGKAISSALQMGQQMIQSKEMGIHVGNERRRNDKVSEKAVQSEKLKEEASSVRQESTSVARTSEQEIRTKALMRQASDIEETKAIESEGQSFEG